MTLTLELGAPLLDVLGGVLVGAIAALLAGVVWIAWAVRRA